MGPNMAIGEQENRTDMIVNHFAMAIRISYALRVQNIDVTLSKG